MRRLHPDDLERLADLVADRLSARLAPATTRAASPTLVDAREAGRRLGRSAVWVRRHSDQLGVVRLGEGDRPRLAFPAEQLADLAACLHSSRSPKREVPAQPARGRRRYQPRGGTSKVALPAGLVYEGAGKPPWAK